MLAAPADQTAIRAARIAQNTAIAAGDLDRATAFWTEDITVRRALGQSLNGRVAARQALEPPATPGQRVIYQRLTKQVEVSLKWPLAVDISFLVHPAGNSDQFTAIKQAWNQNDWMTTNGLPTYTSSLSNSVKTADTLRFDASGNLVKHSGQNSRQNYFTKDSNGYCYSENLTAADDLLASITDGVGCP